MQILQQLLQCTLLLLSACVLWCLAVGSQTADIANAYGVAVVVLAVGTHLFLRPAQLNRPVSGNDIMIPASLPAQRPVVAVNVRHADSTPRPVGGAMHDNQSNLTHKYLFLFYLERESPKMIRKFAENYNGNGYKEI